MTTAERSNSAAVQATAGPTSSSTAKSRRVLACVLCQQRKIKCDKKSPCSNCLKSNAQCEPSAPLPPRQRRRRFPERELLDRLRGYEKLLYQNNINFEPLHKNPSTIQKLKGGSGHDFIEHQQREATTDPDRSSPSPSTTTIGKSETDQAKNFWNAINDQPRDSEEDSGNSSPDDLHDVREAVKKTWDQLYPSNDRLLFGSRELAVDLSTLHPEQVQIFRLWQIYLENVNPLLKVTHTPTLQGRIIEAASNIAIIEPTLAALMFSIYCVSILSLAEEECHATFGSPRDQLLIRYQFGCQQALSNCGFLRSGDRECLTALYLYLISLRASTDPQSLSSLLGLAIRIAQRMGLHSESSYAKCSVLEAEMRRRLWWSLILFDARICELADYHKSVMLVPTWDCNIPLNVNDFDLQSEMKEPPTVYGNSTDALFAVVRSEMADFVRHSAFHLDFVVPALKNVAKDVQHGPVPEGGELVMLNKIIEEKYLKSCNPENPLHFMTIWTARGHLAKSCLLETYSRFSRSSVQQTNTQREAAISYARNMLECDTKLMISPLTKGYLWQISLHFPFLAYIHILQDLRRRPAGDHAEQAWETMSDNYEARFIPPKEHDAAFFNIFAKLVLQAWQTRETSFTQSDKPLVPPRIVSDIRQKVAQPMQDVVDSNLELPSNVLDLSIDDFPMSIPMDFGSYDMFSSMGSQSYEASERSHRQVALNLDMNDSGWNPMDWNPMHGRAW